MHRLLLAVLLSILVLSISPQATAAELERHQGFDYTGFVGARTVPLGAAVYGEVGFDHPLWGDWADKTNFSYGYIRPVISAANAWSINSVDFALSIYPISILGLTIGRMADYRLADSSFSADCTVYQCDGSLREDYGKTNLLLGAAGFFLSTELEWRDIQSSASDQDFYEDSIAIVGRRGHDRLFSQTYSVGKKITDGVTPLTDLVVALNAKRSEALLNGTHAQRLSLAVGHRTENWKFLYVAGVYESSLQGLAPAVGFELAYVGRSGLAY